MPGADRSGQLLFLFFLLCIQLLNHWGMGKVDSCVSDKSNAHGNAVNGGDDGNRFLTETGQ